MVVWDGIGHGCVCVMMVLLMLVLIHNEVQFLKCLFIMMIYGKLAFEMFKQFIFTLAKLQGLCANVQFVFDLVFFYRGEENGKKRKRIKEWNCMISQISVIGINLAIIMFIFDIKFSFRFF